MLEDLKTGRTMQKRVTEHKTAVRKNDKNNGIAVHAWRAEGGPQD